MTLEKFTKKFMMNRDETGRFIVKSYKTGKTYFVEAIDGKEKTVWGDYNPTTKDFETSNYGKYKGSIRPEESMITEDNPLFGKIHTLGPGESPLDYINRIDNEYYKTLKKKKKILFEEDGTPYKIIDGEKVIYKKVEGCYDFSSEESSEENKQ